MAVVSSRPSSAHSFSVWMSRRTCSNSKPRVSTRPGRAPEHEGVVGVRTVAKADPHGPPTLAASAQAGRTKEAGLLQLVQEAPLELGKDLLARERRHLDVDAFLQHRTSSSSASFAWSRRPPARTRRRSRRRPSARPSAGARGRSHGRRTRTRPRTTRSRGRPARAHHRRRGRHNALGEARTRGPAHGARIQSLREPPRRLHQESLRHDEELERAHRCLHHSRARPRPNARGHPRHPYVVNRCSPAEIARVMERPEVVKALGPDIAEAAKESVGDQSAS